MSGCVGSRVSAESFISNKKERTQAGEGAALFTDEIVNNKDKNGLKAPTFYFLTVNYISFFNLICFAFLCFLL